MFIMENVWKSIYFQPTLCERPLLPFYQLGNLSCQFHQGAKMKRWLRGGSHKAMVKKVCHRPTEVFYDFWPIVLFGRICVFSVTIVFLCTHFKYLQSQSQSPKLPTFNFASLYVFLWGNNTKSVLFNMYLLASGVNNSVVHSRQLYIIFSSVTICIWASGVNICVAARLLLRRVANIVNNEM